MYPKPVYMKHTILIAALAVLSVNAYAQRVELGFNSGVNYSYTKIDHNWGYSFSGKGIYNVCSGFQLGLSTGISRVSYENVFNGELLSSSIPPLYPIGDAYTSGTNGVYNLKLLANMKRRVGDVTFYGGISGGVLHGLGNDDFKADLLVGPTRVLENGYTAGLQAGATYHINKRFGFNAELGADYINMYGYGDLNRDKAKTNLSTWNYPVSIGFRYKIGCPCPHRCPLNKETSKPTGDSQ
jgi:hypothetical protein